MVAKQYVVRQDELENPIVYLRSAASNKSEFRKYFN